MFVSGGGFGSRGANLLLIPSRLPVVQSSTARLNRRFSFVNLVSLDLVEVLSLAGSTKRCENDISGSQGPRSIQSPSKNVKITLGEAVDAGGDGNGG